MYQPGPEPQAFVSASTAGLRGADKFEFWRELSRRAGVEVDCELVGRDAFDASAAGIAQDDLSVFRIETSACRFLRRPHRVDTHSLDALVFYFVNAGRLLVEQDGRTARLEAGGGVVCAADRPFAVQCEAHQDIVAIRLPQAFLPQRSDLLRFTGCSLALAGGAGAVVSGFAQGLAREVSTMDRATLQDRLGDFAGLLNAAFDVMAQGPFRALSHKVLVLQRVKAHIRQQLGDPGLRPSTVAQTLRLSQRYLNKLFAEEGTSLARFIWEERLQRAAQALRRSASSVPSITAVALDSGFSNMSHFSRAFRDRFGVSPRGYRTQHVLPRPLPVLIV